jgi:hypothetical protein
VVGIRYGKAVRVTRASYSRILLHVALPGLLLWWGAETMREGNRLHRKQK